MEFKFFLLIFISKQQQLPIKPNGKYDIYVRFIEYSIGASNKVNGCLLFCGPCDELVTWSRCGNIKNIKQQVVEQI